MHRNVRLRPSKHSLRVGYKGGMATLPNETLWAVQLSFNKQGLAAPSHHLMVSSHDKFDDSEREWRGESEWN
jgi:hypothetical protein